jgi:hypothetical protein
LIHKPKLYREANRASNFCHNFVSFKIESQDTCYQVAIGFFFFLFHKIFSS